MRKSTTSAKHRVYQFLCQSTLYFAAIFALLAILGCTGRYGDQPTAWPGSERQARGQGVGRFQTVYLADQIESYYRGSNPGPIGVTTFVNLDDLYTSSTFGRMYGEQLMSELAMRGFDVVELRHADALQFISNEGEFALSRQSGQIRRERQLGGVVVGTYVVSPSRVYVNARLIDPASSLVLSAGTVEFEKTNELARLLRGGTLPSSLERIPVRHLGLQTFPLPSTASYAARSEEGDDFSFSMPSVQPPTARIQPRILEDRESNFGGLRIDRGRPENPVDSKLPPPLAPAAPAE